MDSTPLPQEGPGPIERIDGRLYARWRPDRAPYSRQTRIVVSIFAAVVLVSVVACCFVGVPLVPLFLVYRRRLRSVAPTVLRGLSPDPPEIPVYPVRVWLTAGPWRYGDDAGMLAQSDGWLHYEGIGFTFSMRNADALWSQKGDEVSFTLADGRKMRIFLMNRWEEGTGISTAGATAAIRTWSVVPAPEGQSVFPPYRCRSPREATRNAPIPALVAVASSVPLLVYGMQSSSDEVALRCAYAALALLVSSMLIVIIAALRFPKTLRPKQ